MWHFTYFFLEGLAEMIPIAIAVALILRLLVWPVYRKMVIFQHRDTLVDLMATLQVIINTEEQLYTDYIFNFQDPDHGSMTNAQYENAYRELCAKILGSISDTMWMQFDIYMTRESIATYITEEVQKYLKSKIKGVAL